MKFFCNYQALLTQALIRSKAECYWKGVSNPHFYSINFTGFHFGILRITRSTQ